MSDPSASTASPPPFWRRLAGFTLLPVLAAVSPLAVLPVVARSAGAEGWTSAVAGEAVGTFAGIAIAFGWNTIGPAWVADATDGSARGLLYRESLVMRGALSVLVLPVLAVICAAVSSPGFEMLAILMGFQGALIALTFTWFAVGVGSPGEIALFDAVPRLIAAVLAAVAIGFSGINELYPIAGISVTLIGTALYSRRVLRRYPSHWPHYSEIRRLLGRNGTVATTEAALGLYSAVPVPLVNVIAPGITAAGLASADKMGKLGQFLPLSLANALQSWTAEVSGQARQRRVRLAVLAHTALGILGFLGLALLGTFVSSVLFGPAATATPSVLVVIGIAFAAFSIRTSLARHLLFPAGRSRSVMYATLLASIVGLPLMVGLGAAAGLGPVGVAAGYAFIEVVSTALLLRPSVAAYRALMPATESGR